MVVAAGVCVRACVELVVGSSVVVAAVVGKGASVVVGVDVAAVEGTGASVVVGVDVGQALLESLA